MGAAGKCHFFCVCVCLFVCVAVNFICDHPAIQAISFVGSNSAGEYIYERGSKNGKRVQSNMVRACASRFLFLELNTHISTQCKHD